MSKLESMPKCIKFYYDAWIEREFLFGHPLDDAKFFHFVRAVFKYSRSRRGLRDSQWLRQHLERDGRVTNRAWIEQAVRLFSVLEQNERALRSFRAHDVIQWEAQHPQSYESVKVTEAGIVERCVVDPSGYDVSGIPRRSTAFDAVDPGANQTHR